MSRFPPSNNCIASGQNQTQNCRKSKLMAHPNNDRSNNVPYNRCIPGRKTNGSQSINCAPVRPPIGRNMQKEGKKSQFNFKQSTQSSNKPAGQPSIDDASPRYPWDMAERQPSFDTGPPRMMPPFCGYPSQPYPMMYPPAPHMNMPPGYSPMYPMGGPMPHYPDNSCYYPPNKDHEHHTSEATTSMQTGPPFSGPPKDSQKQDVEETTCGNPPRWKTSAPETPTTRFITATIQGCKHWSIYKDKLPMLFEVTGVLSSAVISNKSETGKEFLLKDDKDSMTCVFYEMDRPMPHLIRGQSCRCVGRLLDKPLRFHCVSVRSSTEQERKLHRALVLANDKIMRRAVAGLPEH